LAASLSYRDALGEFAEKLINDDKCSRSRRTVSGHADHRAAMVERYGVRSLQSPLRGRARARLQASVRGAASPDVIESMLTKFNATKPDLHSIAISAVRTCIRS
jgi:hypothetical protein